MLLELENVKYSYPHSDWTLGRLSLSVDAGRLVGIVGPNGSGKSTLVKVASGICEPTSGTVKLKNRNIDSMARREVARVLGYLPQNVESAFNYRVGEVVAMGRYAHLEGMGFLRQKDIDAVNESMELTDTAKYMDRHLNQLSGGERQRVLLASSLCQQPEILLLDEPTTGLDLHHQVSFFEILRKLTLGGMAVVVVTHDLNLAAMFCDELMLVSRGKILKSGGVEDVINEQTLTGLYPNNIYIGRHPVNDRPMVLPICGGGDE